MLPEGVSAGKQAGLSLDLTLVLAGSAHKRSGSPGGGDSLVGLTLLLLGAGSEEPDSLVGLTLVLCLSWVRSAGESRVVSLLVCMGVRVIRLSSWACLSIALALLSMVLCRCLVDGRGMGGV